MEERLDRIALILRAIDLTIAEVEAREASEEQDEQLQILRSVRLRWMERSVNEGGG